MSDQLRAIVASMEDLAEVVARLQGRVRELEVRTPPLEAEGLGGGPVTLRLRGYEWRVSPSEHLNFDVPHLDWRREGQETWISEPAPMVRELAGALARLILAESAAK